MQTVQSVRWGGQANTSDSVQIMFSGRVQWELCYCSWRVSANEVSTEEAATSGTSLYHFPHGTDSVPKHTCQINDPIDFWAKETPWFSSSVFLKILLTQLRQNSCFTPGKKQERLINWLHKLMWHILRVGHILTAIYGLSLLVVLELLWFVLGSVCPVLF